MVKRKRYVALLRFGGSSTIHMAPVNRFALLWRSSVLSTIRKLLTLKMS